MDQEYRYFALSAAAGTLPHGYDDTLAAVLGIFPDLEADEQAGVERFRAKQQQLAMLGAPPPVLAIYGNMRAARIRIAADLPPGCFVEFTIWEFTGTDPVENDGSVASNKAKALAVRPSTDDCFEACRTVAQKLTDALSYELEAAFGYE